MKMKVLILCRDTEYADLLQKGIISSYLDRISVSFFTDRDLFQKEIMLSFPDVIIIGEEYANAEFETRENSGVAYFVEKNNIETLNGKKAIGKYQPVSKICNDFLDLYADVRAKTEDTLKGSISGKRIMTFLSPAGGVGTSSAAAGCARRLAAQGKRVLYLNLELLGNSERFFSGDGVYSFSRVIYALEMANSASVAKMESALRQDESGVWFYSACESPLDLLSVNAGDMVQLFEEFSSISCFDWIITDMDCSLSDDVMEQIARSYMVVLLSDGTPSANDKLKRYLDAIEVLAQNRKSIHTERIVLLYNKFSSQHGQMLENVRARYLGKIPRIRNANDVEITKLIAENTLFDALIL